MAQSTKIEWTDSTFNPAIGCQKVSPGCDHCYAETQNAFRGWTNWGPHGVRKRTSAANWRNPVTWNAAAAKFQAEHGRRQRVFSASLADVMDNAWDPSLRSDFFALICATPELDWLLLTKRPQNYAKFLPPDWGDGYPNVWLGFTAEDDKHYHARWKHVREIPAAVRFVSYEPGLGEIAMWHSESSPDWIISGGESGGKARLMDPKWARFMRDQCQIAGIAFFHKQWGTWASNPLVCEHGMSKAEAEKIDTFGKGGGLLDGRLWREFPTPRRIVHPAFPSFHPSLLDAA